MGKAQELRVSQRSSNRRCASLVFSRVPRRRTYDATDLFRYTDCPPASFEWILPRVVEIDGFYNLVLLNFACA
jgi:hypothetical protein